MSDDSETDPTVESSDAHAATKIADSRGPREHVLEVLAEYSPSTFEVGAELGRGGIGRVLQARDPMFDRPIAIKELLSDRPEARARFLREAMITARLQHPSIVPVYLAGRWPDGAPFYAMKLVAGQPLSKLVRTASDLDARIAMLPSLIAVCDAIAFAHRARIIHRDLKPGNVLIGELGETIVIDWGLAKDLDAADDTHPGTYEAAATSGETVDGSVFGTPAYMAPEQAAGRVVDERADVYALGAMLYELLAGRAPYADRPGEKGTLPVLERAPTPIGTLVPTAPRDLVAIVERAMQREPAARYPDARELVADLRRFTAGQLVSVREYGALERAARWIRKHRAVVSVAAIAAVVTIVIATVAISNVVASARIARTKAAEAETARQGESERADAEVLARAAALVERDPTAAIASLTRMRGDVMPARPIAAEAASRGVAWIIGPSDMETPSLHLTDDDRYLIIGGSDSRKIIVHDLASGAHHEVAVGEVSELSDRIVYSLDGPTLVAEDVVSGEKHRYVAPAKIEYPDESSNRAWLAGRTSVGSTIWNAASGEARTVPSPNAGLFGALIVDDEGTLVEVAPDRREVWITSSTAHRKIAFPPGPTSKDNLLALPSPDGTRVVLIEPAVRRVHVLEVAKGTWTAFDVDVEDLRSASFHSDGALYAYGKRLVRCTLENARWACESLEDTRSIRTRGQWVVGFTPTKIWLRNRDRELELPINSPWNTAAVTMSGDTLFASPGDRTIRRWDLRAVDGPVCGSGAIELAGSEVVLVSGTDLVSCNPKTGVRRVLHGVGSKAAVPVLDSNASWILTISEGPAREFVRWDRTLGRADRLTVTSGWRPAGVLDDGRIVEVSKTGVRIVDSGGVEPRCAAMEQVFSQEVGTMILGLRANKLTACDVARDQIIELASDPDEPDVAALAADRSLVVLYRKKHPTDLILWDRAKGIRTVTLSAGVGSLAISDDGQHVVLVSLDEARIIDRQGATTATIRFATGGARNAILSPSGDRMIAMDLRSSIVELYDVARGTRQSIPGIPATENARFVDDDTIVFVDIERNVFRASDSLPRTAAELRRWLETATNAVINDRGVVSAK